MEKDITGKTIDEAVEKACRELNAERGTFSYEIVDYPKQGFLGIGGRPAVIRISYRTQEEIEAEKKAEEAERAARKEWDAQNPRSDRGPRAPRGDRGPKKDRGPRMNRAPRPEPEEPVEEPIPEPEAEKEFVFCENTKIEKFLVGMFETMGVAEYEIHVTDEDQKEITVENQSEQLSFLGRRQGEAVDGLQTLVSLYINKEKEDFHKVMLDVNGIKKKTAHRLEALAVRVAKQVLKTRRKVTLNPMSAYQRRVIHSRLQGFRNIQTYSVGTEPNRRVVVAYVFPGEKKAEERKSEKPEKAENEVAGKPETQE